MSDDPRVRALVDKINAVAADSGSMVETGFAAYCAIVLPGADKAEKDRHRIAFFAGAQHVFATLIGVMSDHDDPTPADLMRMDKLHAELETFAGDMRALLAPPRGSA